MSARKPIDGMQLALFIGWTVFIGCLLFAFFVVGAK